MLALVQRNPQKLNQIISPNVAFLLIMNDIFPILAMLSRITQSDEVDLQVLQAVVLPQIKPQLTDLIANPGQESHYGQLLPGDEHKLNCELGKVEWNKELQMPYSSFFTTVDIEPPKNKRVELLWSYFTDDYKRGNIWK